MNATISLQEYLGKSKIFLIPNYQRGYIWGQKRKGASNGAVDSVSYMLESLINGYQSNTDIFIQGVTVSESQSAITVIDGQQRTTFFFLLLKYLGYNGKFTIEYMIRRQSNEYLSKDGILNDFSERPDEPFQDIYFFKKTLKIIDDRLKESDIDRAKFLCFILCHVKFLYIDIPEHKAKTVFTMMNGNKAEMKTEELIKAELLRIASLNSEDFDHKDIRTQNAIEWDNNMLRSRYAREWDKWLQWWNREDVRKFFRTQSVMGLLISSFLQIYGEQISFDSFKKNFLPNGLPTEAKCTIARLRRLQKRFEDVFNDAVRYNKIGAILRVATNREDFIKWYFGEIEVPSSLELDDYYKKCFIGMTYRQIRDNDAEAFDNKFEETYDALSSNNLYIDNIDEAFKLLLRLNIDEDNKQEDGQGRKFDFSIWDRNDSRGRSLEHIYPKSKVWHVETADGNTKYITGAGSVIDESTSNSHGYISRDSCRYTNPDGEQIIASEHSIGNLVLLYKDDNSAFNDSSYEEKKQLFFKVPSLERNKKIKDIFKSRHLLHTIYKFALSNWDGTEIAKNKYLTLKEFREYYGK